MNKIKEVLIEAYPELHKLWKNVITECGNGCANCTLYKASFHNYNGNPCAYLAFKDIFCLASELVTEENLKKGTTNA